MNIRRANEKDIPRLIELLGQVLQIHADIRPDIFIAGTTKYTNEEQIRFMLLRMKMMCVWMHQQGGSILEKPCLNMLKVKRNVLAAMK